jgi:hypothetical protein
MFQEIKDEDRMMREGAGLGVGAVTESFWERWELASEK